MAAVLDLLGAEWFRLWGTPVTAAEALGFVTGAACVWLVARQHVANWPIGLANNALFALLFWRAGLYAETALQGVFAALAVYGWWAWRGGGSRASGSGGGEPQAEGAARAPLSVRRATRVEVAWLGLAAAVGTAAVAWLLASRTNSAVPVPDALVLALSLVATYGQAQKLVESWWMWIAVDVISVPLYLSRGLLLTAVLYAGFLALCVVGLRAWTAELRARRVPAGLRHA